jgi:hypothetical protein
MTKYTIPADARTPFDLMLINWETRDETPASGTTAAPAWEVQHIIETLEQSGYTILTVNRSY